MIHLEGLDSIIESVYLSEGLSNKLGVSNIFVNPDNIKYIANKLVIISDTNYPVENVDILLNNNNKIISRIFIDNEQVEVQPYIIRINDRIMWNGRRLNEVSDLDDLLLQGQCDYEEKKGTLYFPQIFLEGEENSKRLMDSFGNLTCLGWALHQVGVNLKESPFMNLDLLKTGKVVI